MALTYAMHEHSRSDSHEDEAYGGDMVEAESMMSGSVTSFVRKLFQMVQAECDSVVGFVADGTAFEVKDPRRLEQDILPKYFRHSRFQSLVRQLNFYSFKKISKERSVWIYKHAFFRRDEPQLLHALKRKTNQQGGGRMFGGAMMLDSEPDEITLERIRQASLCRESHINKPRLRTVSIHHDHHHALQHHPSSSFHSNNANRSRHPSQMTHRLDSSSRANGARLYHASNSRSAGGGPSTGGIGGSAAPCYDSRGVSPRASGYDWAGAGGHPVTAGGDGLAHGSAHRTLGLRGGSPAPREMAPYAYQEETVADDRRNSPKRSSSPEGARSSDRDEALALWGLSALCQVACAEDGTSLSEDSRRRSGGFSRGPPSKVQRSFEDGEGNQLKRARRGDFRRGWGGAVGDGNGRDNETSDEGEEDCITSAEHDDSAVYYRSPSASHGISASSDSDSSTPGSPRQRSIASAVKHRNRSCDNGEDYYEEVKRNAKSEYNHPKRSSGGVFCSKWDWGTAVKERAMRLPESFVDRRLGELDRTSCEDGHPVEMNGEDDEESIKTEAEDVDDDEEEAMANNGVGDLKTYAAVKETRVAITPRPRDPNADKEAEAAVGLKGIGELLAQLCAKANSGTSSDSVYLATVTNSGDSGLREMAVFGAGPAGNAPDMAPPESLARQVSSFLQAEEAIAQDLRVYAEALDPAAVDVVGGIIRQAAVSVEPRSSGACDDSKLLRVFCRYAACRLGRAHEVTSAAAAAVDDVQTDDDSPEQQSQREVAERVTPMLDECRWKWWRAAVRFS